VPVGQKPNPRKKLWNRRGRENNWKKNWKLVGNK